MSASSRVINISPINKNTEAVAKYSLCIFIFTDY